MWFDFWIRTRVCRPFEGHRLLRWPQDDQNLPRGIPAFHSKGKWQICSLINQGHTIPGGITLWRCRVWECLVEVHSADIECDYCVCSIFALCIGFAGAWSVLLLPASLCPSCLANSRTQRYSRSRRGLEVPEVKLKVFIFRSHNSLAPTQARIDSEFPCLLLNSN